MTAQIWLWAVLSGLGIGFAGWGLRGWQASGREMRIKRAWEKRLFDVEEDARRTLVRARAVAAEDRRRLEAERDRLLALSVESDLMRTALPNALNPPSPQANGNGASPAPPSSRPTKRRRARNGAEASPAHSGNTARSGNGLADPDRAQAS